MMPIPLSTKIVDSFWERVPYICIAIVVFLIFWLLTKLFKFFVRKTLENRLILVKILF